MSSGYYLLDHWAPPAGTKMRAPWRTTRQGHLLRAVTWHTAESGADLEGEDTDAERLARYFASGPSDGRTVSAHFVSDRDSHIQLLPAEYTAWHARPFKANWRTVGLEIAGDANMWGRLTDEQTNAYLVEAAAAIAPTMLKYRIPPVWITPHQLDEGQKGMLTHAQLDPSRRSDPGPEFPFERAAEMVKLELHRLSAKPQATIRTGKLEVGDMGDDVLQLTTWLHVQGFLADISSIYSDAVSRAVAKYQKAVGLKPNGIADKQTFKRLEKGAVPLLNATERAKLRRMLNKG